MRCRIVPFVPGRRPTDEIGHPGLGSSDNVALITHEHPSNRSVLLFEVSDVPSGSTAEVTMTVDSRPLPGWENRNIELAPRTRQRIELLPEDDLSGIDLGLSSGFLRKVKVELRIADGEAVATDSAWLEACDARNLGSLYGRILHDLLSRDTTRQARRAGVPDPGGAYHPMYPVLKIGADKAALYNAALVADIVDKEHNLTDPAWLLRVGVYLELLTCMGIFEAVRHDVGDLLQPDERAAFEQSETLAPIRQRIDAAAWREVWRMRRIIFPSFGRPRTGPVSALNLLRKKEATLRFLHVHHEDLKQAIALAGPNVYNSQETWQRVFRDAERAVLRQAVDAFPEIGFLPAPARDVILWQRLGFSGQKGLYPTACGQYRSSMNSVAAWAKARGLMDYAGPECVPTGSSLLEAHMNEDQARVEMLQRQDGLAPDLIVPEPMVVPKPTVEEIEQLLAGVSIFKMMSPQDIHDLAAGARPLLLGPTERFLVEGQEGTSLFLVGEGEVEVRRRRTDGTDWLVETMGPGEVVGEMALLTGEKRAATVRSVEETVIYEIGREAYEPLLVAHPEWLDELAAVMQQRLERRRTRAKEMKDDHNQGSLLELIRRNFFG